MTPKEYFSFKDKIKKHDEYLENRIFEILRIMHPILKEEYTKRIQVILSIGKYKTKYFLSYYRNNLPKYIYSTLNKQEAYISRYILTKTLFDDKLFEQYKQEIKIQKLWKEDCFKASKIIEEEDKKNKIQERNVGLLNWYIVKNILERVRGQGWLC